MTLAKVEFKSRRFVFVCEVPDNHGVRNLDDLGFASRDDPFELNDITGLNRPFDRTAANNQKIADTSGKFSLKFIASGVEDDETMRAGDSLGGIEIDVGSLPTRRIIQGGFAQVTD